MTPSRLFKQKNNAVDPLESTAYNLKWKILCAKELLLINCFHMNYYFSSSFFCEGADRKFHKFFSRFVSKIPPEDNSKFFLRRVLNELPLECQIFAEANAAASNPWKALT